MKTTPQVAPCHFPFHRAGCLTLAVLIALGTHSLQAQIAPSPAPAADPSTVPPAVPGTPFPPSVDALPPTGPAPGAPPAAATGNRHGRGSAGTTLSVQLPPTPAPPSALPGTTPSAAPAPATAAYGSGFLGQAAAILGGSGSPQGPASSGEGAPTPSALPPPNFSGAYLTLTPPPPSSLSQAMMAESQANPAAAVPAYEAIVAQFDQQRSTAAQAVFRLAEVYRRMGRNEEARALHARILREFVDFPELAQQSLRVLSNTASQISFPDAPTQAPTMGFNFSPKAAAYRKEELGLLEAEIARTKKMIDQGMADAGARFPLERERLRLNQQIAADEDMAARDRANASAGRGSQGR